MALEGFSAQPRPEEKNDRIHVGNHIPVHTASSQNPLGSRRSRLIWPGVIVATLFVYLNFPWFHYVARSSVPPASEGEATNNQWRAALEAKFDVLGPFPQQAREQHFLSPSYPLGVTALRVDTITRNDSFPTSFSDGGLVSWTEAKRSQDGRLRVSFPSVRWGYIRATQGWAGLQHHSLMHATISIQPPAEDGGTNGIPQSLCIDVRGASYFALLPRSTDLDHGKVKWYTGNIYSLPAPCQIIPLPEDMSQSQVTKLDLWVSADYEIRLFGDPVVNLGQTTPVTEVVVSVSLDSGLEPVFIGKHHFIPDVVGGVLMGEAIGLEVISQHGRWRIDLAESIGSPEVVVGLAQSPLFVEAGQTRRLPLIIHQQSPTQISSIDLRLTLGNADTSSNSAVILEYKLPLLHIPPLDTLSAEALAKLEPIRQTHWSPHASLSLLLPPLNINAKSFTKPVLALHGAGVELGSPFWPSALPRQQRSWIVIPGGGSSWGYDWRGPSVQDCFAAVAALRKREGAERPMGEGVLVLGHSNGGQGAFHLASRYPDFARTAMPAAAYQSAPLYVPNTWAHSVHFLDPALKGILHASLAGGDNDLFLGNLVRSRVRVVHGGEDSNVPVYHSRTAVQVVKTWHSSADVQLLEVPHKDHWWDEVFTEPSRASLVSQLLSDPDSVTSPTDYTLTVMWPQDSGSMGGWEVLALLVPGRLSRVIVRGSCNVATTNVLAFSAETSRRHCESITVDSQPIRISGDDIPPKIIFKRQSDGLWKIISQYRLRPSGPISRILASSESLLFVVPAERQSWRNAAKRLAWALYAYLGLDVQILTDTEATTMLPGINPANGTQGSVVLFGGPGVNAYAGRLLSQPNTPFSFNGPISFSIHGKEFNVADTGLLFMHENHLILHVNGDGEQGIERVLRAFPLRTGVSCPEWMIIGSHSDNFGMGGLLGAGFWGSSGQWSEEMSWLA